MLPISSCREEGLAEAESERDPAEEVGRRMIGS